MAAADRLTPAERSMRARLASHESWARTANRSERTATARQAFKDRFIREARERFGDLPEQELQQRAESLRQAHFTKMALRSAVARRRKVAAEAELAEIEAEIEAGDRDGG